MQVISAEEIKNALESMGIRRGSVVYLATDLRGPGMIASVKNRDDFCKVYLDIIRVIGPEGTLVVPTFTTQIARFDMNFIWEETPSVLGTFAEYIRTKTKKFGSLHLFTPVQL